MMLFDRLRTMLYPSSIVTMCLSGTASEMVHNDAAAPGDIRRKLYSHSLTNSPRLIYVKNGDFLKYPTCI